MSRQAKRELSRWWIPYHVWIAFTVFAFLSRSGVFSRLAWSITTATDRTDSALALRQVLLWPIAAVAGYLLSLWMVRSVAAASTTPRTKKALLWFLPFAFGIAAGQYAPKLHSFVWSAAERRPESPSAASAVFRLAAPSVASIKVFGWWPRSTHDADAQFFVSTKPVVQGSGIAIGGTLIASNCHVLRAGRVWEISIQGHTYRSASLVESDPERDLCVLNVQGLTAASATRRSGSLTVGETVYSIGAPQGLDLTIGQGLVSGIRQDASGARIQTTAPISPGSSGGGLFDEQARLIGITTFMIRDGENLNFAIPASWIDELPARSSAYSDLSRRLSEKHARTCAGAEALGDYRVMLSTAQAWTTADPYSVEAWTCLGKAASFAQDLRPAVSALQRAISLEPSPDLYVSVGIAYYMAALRQLAVEKEDPDPKLWKEASAAYELAIATDETNAEAWFRLAQVRNATGAYGDAIVAAEHAVERDASHAFAWDELSTACAGFGKPDCAVMAARRSTSLAPADERHWITLRAAARAAGNRHLEALADDRIASSRK